MPKTDYYDDPNAPRANSLVVAVAALVRNSDGQVLLIRRGDNGLWAIPGGAQELGETPSQAVVREVREETGLEVEVTGIDGIYSDPRHLISYDDGEVRQEFSIVCHARPVGGAPRPSTESLEVRWVDTQQIDQFAIEPSMRMRIDHGLADEQRPYLS